MSGVTYNELYLPKNSLQIYIREYIPDNSGTMEHAIPAIITCHGFGSNCSENYDYCEFFASHGYAAFCFDFCGGSCEGEGKSTGNTIDMNVWTECEDLSTVFSYVKKQKYIDSSNITLMGTSQGGFVSGLTAAKYGGEVKNLVMVCPALCIPDDARRGRLGGGSYDIADVPDEIQCPNKMVIGKQYHDAVVDMDPFLELVKYEGNVLLMQGMLDKIVNYSYAVKLSNHYKQGQCQLKLVRNAEHGFSENLKNSAMATILNFLEGKKEILTIQVFITGSAVIEQQENNKKTEVYFTGYCDNEYFKGVILPGAKDMQSALGNGLTELRAEYTLSGTDYEGNVCKINIVNQRKGEFFCPQITTDSPALSKLNSGKFTAALEGFENGLTVRIFGNI